MEFDQKAQMSRIVLLRNSNVREEELRNQKRLELRKKCSQQLENRKKTPPK